MPYFLVEGYVRQSKLGIALTIFNGSPDSRFLTTIEAKDPQSAIDEIFEEYQKAYGQAQSLPERFAKNELSEEEEQAFITAAEPIEKKQWKAKEISREKATTLRAMITRGRRFDEIEQRVIS